MAGHDPFERIAEALNLLNAVKGVDEDERFAIELDVRDRFGRLPEAEQTLAKEREMLDAALALRAGDLADVPQFDADMAEALVREVADDVNAELLSVGVDISVEQADRVSELVEDRLLTVTRDNFTPQQFAELPTLERFATRHAIDKSEQLRAFPSSPLREHQINRIVRAMEAAGRITQEQRDAILLPGTGSPELEIQAAGFYDRLIPQVSDIMGAATNAVVSRGATDIFDPRPATLIRELTLLLDSESPEDVRQDRSIVPNFEGEGSQLRAEHRQALVAEAFGLDENGKPRDLKAAVDDYLLFEHGIDTQASAYADPEEAKAVERQRDAVLANLRLRRAHVLAVWPDATEEEIQADLQAAAAFFTEDFMDDALLAWTQAAGQEQRETEQTATGSKTAATQLLFDYGLNRSDISPERAFQLEQNIFRSGSGEVRAFQDTQPFLNDWATEKRNQDFVEGGEEEVGRALRQQGIGGLGDTPYEQHIRDVVVPQVTARMQEAFANNPAGFRPDRFIGQILGLPSSRQAPQDRLVGLPPELSHLEGLLVSDLNPRNLDELEAAGLSIKQLGLTPRQPVLAAFEQAEARQPQPEQGISRLITAEQFQGQFGGQPPGFPAEVQQALGGQGIAPLPTLESAGVIQRQEPNLVFPEGLAGEVELTQAARELSGDDPQFQQFLLGRVGSLVPTFREEATEADRLREVRAVQTIDQLRGAGPTEDQRLRRDQITRLREEGRFTPEQERRLDEQAAVRERSRGAFSQVEGGRYIAQIRDTRPERDFLSFFRDQGPQLRRLFEQSPAFISRRQTETARAEREREATDAQTEREREATDAQTQRDRERSLRRGGRTRTIRRL